MIHHLPSSSLRVHSVEYVHFADEAGNLIITSSPAVKPPHPTPPLVSSCSSSHTWYHCTPLIFIHGPLPFLFQLLLNKKNKKIKKSPVFRQPLSAKDNCNASLSQATGL